MSAPRFYILDDKNQPIAVPKQEWDKNTKTPCHLHHNLGPRHGRKKGVSVLSSFHSNGDHAGLFCSTLSGAEHISAYTHKEYVVFAQSYDEMIENHLSLYRTAIEWCPVVQRIQDYSITILPGVTQSRLFVSKGGLFTDESQISGRVKKDVVLWMTEDGSYRLSPQAHIFSDWTDDQIRSIIAHGEKLTRFSYRWDYFDKAALRERDAETEWEDLAHGWYCWDSATDFSGEDNTFGPYDTEMECLRYIVEQWGVDEEIFGCEFDAILGIWPWAEDEFYDLIEEWDKEGVIEEWDEEYRDLGKNF